MFGSCFRGRVQPVLASVQPVLVGMIREVEEMQRRLTVAQNDEKKMLLRAATAETNVSLLEDRLRQSEAEVTSLRLQLEQANRQSVEHEVTAKVAEARAVQAEANILSAMGVALGKLQERNAALERANGQAQVYASEVLELVRASVELTKPFRIGLPLVSPGTSVLHDPMTKKLMRVPTLLLDTGDHYEAAYIIKYLSDPAHTTCPMGKPLTTRRFVKDVTIMNITNALRSNHTDTPYEDPVTFASTGTTMERSVADARGLKDYVSNTALKALLNDASI